MQIAFAIFSCLQTGKVFRLTNGLVLQKTFLVLIDYNAPSGCECGTILCATIFNFRTERCWLIDEVSTSNIQNKATKP